MPLVLAAPHFGLLRWPLRTLRHLSNATRRTAWAARTMLVKRFGRSDVAHWANLDNYPRDWNQRTLRLAAWVPPASRVVEFGAGRQALKRALPEDCTYMPFDLVQRDADTRRYDLNERPLRPLPPCDVVVLSGVLEYLSDLDQVAAHLAASCTRVVTSYAGVEFGGRNEHLLERRGIGWFNDFTSDQVEAIFRRNGFVTVARERWTNQTLLCFDRALAY